MVMKSWCQTSVSLLLALFCRSVELSVDFIALSVYNNPVEAIHHSVDISHAEVFRI